MRPGVLADGTAVDGVVALRDALVARPDVFVRTLTEKLMTYALGRGLQHYDMPVVRAIVRKAEKQNYRFSALIMGIVDEHAVSDARGGRRATAPARSVAAA